MDLDPDLMGTRGTGGGDGGHHERPADALTAGQRVDEEPADRVAGRRMPREPGSSMPPGGRDERDEPDRTGNCVVGPGFRRPHGDGSAGRALEGRENAGWGECAAWHAAWFPAGPDEGSDLRPLVGIPEPVCAKWLYLTWKYPTWP